MKKNLFIIIQSVFIIFIFSGCDLLLSMLGGSLENDTQYTYEIKNASKYKNSNWYLIKQNNSTDYTVQPYATGYIANTSRSAEINEDSEESDEKAINLSDIIKNQNKDGFSTWNDTELIRKIDEDFAKKYEASAERASATKVTSTIQTASHKVG
ncbi:MAG: hypothetical protein K6A43_10910, partial [Treponema sp.]|nr:hypothetical protein [Treponema sp.]